MIKVPISLGELVDKITILELKLEYIRDKEKINNIQKEYNLLLSILKEATNIPRISRFQQKLKKINRELWKIEDKIRDCEQHQDFSNKFIELARSVYITNDKRASLKKEINICFGSDLVEEKSYQKY